MARRLQLPDALPPLGGWAGTAYLAVWLPLLAITLWLAAGTAWYGIVDGAGDAYAYHALGINRGNDDGALIDRVAGNEARAAGVRPGDRILAYDGIVMPQQAASDRQDWQIKAHLVETRGPVRLLLQSGRRRPPTVMLTRSAAHGDALYAGTGFTPTSLSWLGTITNLLAPLVLIAGGCLLFARRRDAVAALLSIAMLGLAAISPYTYYYLLRFDAERLPDAMNMVGTTVLLLTLLLFPSGRFVPRWTFWAIVFLPVFMAIRLVVPALAQWIGPIFVLLAVTAMIVRYRREAPANRRQ